MQSAGCHFRPGDLTMREWRALAELDRASRELAHSEHQEFRG